MTSLRNSRFLRLMCFVMALLAVNLAFPHSLLWHDPNAPVRVKEEPKEKLESRPLTEKEMDSLSGKLGNPYYAGQAKWDIVYKGVNLRTGNFSTSATDLSFEGGYGVPINVTRTYNANCLDEGPLGLGWQLSVDLRTTAGGLLKSPNAPVRSTPTNFRKQPSQETDPNSPFSPIEAVVATDAGGEEETIQRDVDGILTTPPWDKNMMEPEYEIEETGSGSIWLLVSNKVITPEGTVYQYAKQGEYTSGVTPFDNNVATPEPSNILKVTSVKDRHNNETTYTYGSAVTFAKANGTVSENKLLSIDMPNGRSIDFTWTSNRITGATDGTRTVTYGYDGSSRLNMVTSPGGKKTRYGWGVAVNISGGNIGGSFLTSIKDPRGLETTIGYASDITTPDSPVVAYKVVSPNGVYSYFSPEIQLRDMGDSGFSGTIASDWGIMEKAGGLGGTIINEDYYDVSVNHSARTYTIMSDDVAAGSRWMRSTYSLDTQDLMEAMTTFKGTSTSNHSPNTYANNVVTVTKDFNFLGQPLKEATTEVRYTSGGTATRSFQTDYAYWGEDKYFQQKGVRVKTGSSSYRYSFTDYYDSSATMGKRGQTYRVYDPKHGDLILDNTLPIPDWVHPVNDADVLWKYHLRPNDASKYSAQFDYDSKGRPTSVWKIRATGSPYTYVRTDSTYGGDGSPAYGNATAVTEDVGGIARVTETLTFDVAGRAIETEDALGRVFYTEYDPDGLVEAVTRTDTNPDVPIVSYVYGTTDLTVENGQPTDITDHLSGVGQGIEYVQSGTAKGQPLEISETLGSVSYDVTYGYNAIGERETATYDTPEGDWRVKYDQYETFGFGHSPKRAFKRVNKQTWTGSAWADSAEEFKYTFDDIGRLYTATFAMSPQSGQTNYASFDPQSRAVATYDYDAGGRVNSIQYHWQNLVSGNYVTTPMHAFDATYAHPLGLKDSAGFFNESSGVFSLARRENYSYDADLDYLLEVDYNDGLSNEVTTWTYDAAGNRASASDQSGSWTYDNLNRMSASPNHTYSNNILGNTTDINSIDLEWDELNRLTAMYDAVHESYWQTYEYRADGMRTQQVDVNFNYTKRFRYDGQMPVETASFNGTSSLTWTSTARNVLGARGIDALSTETSGGTVSTYPLYDTHGNVKAYVKREPSNTWSSLGWKQYNVWGGVRSSSGGAGTSSAYVGNLGHVSDAETGLIYMRARYYAPWAGRFVSEDPARDGFNWYSYAENLPTCLTDPGGMYTDWSALFMASGAVLALMSWGAAGMGLHGPAIIFAQYAVTLMAMAFNVDQHVFGNDRHDFATPAGTMGLLMNGIPLIGKKLAERSPWLGGVLSAAEKGVGNGRLAGIALAGIYVYTLVLCGALLALDNMD